MTNINNIKKEVLFYNRKLLDSGLVFNSFGNLSVRCQSSFIIKPSGVNLQKIIPYDFLNTNRLFFLSLNLDWFCEKY